ncbi:threonine/serine ThrE exporter family protein [Tahibacter amnicola]|uniref:Threonine/serine exporter family protein n=1 Tax=Tahibacter amnicola TaxID=2976241 RepID=A0ABY6BGT7_9GAMM|nr:threonine/serine exporter family protein [Tahibacter amnicola]UXI69243.1 threonine/serine exporter family protein [Tahibacter amnicola]
MNEAYTLTTRVGFVIALARRLHEYGTAAPRLEEAIAKVSARLELYCDVLSTPTSIVLSFAEHSQGRHAVAQVTQVIRLAPGEVNLRRLCEVDHIADRVIDGSLDLQAGYKMLREQDRPDSARTRWMTVLSFGASSASVAMLLKTSLVDIAVAALCGWLIGLLAHWSRDRPRLSASFEAVSALLVTVIATAFSAFVAPLTLKPVVLASLIVLLPGMSLTTAVRELSNQHLVSGVARVAGATATLLKLTFGTVAAAQLCRVTGIVPAAEGLPPAPAWVEWAGLIMGAMSFAVLFRSARRDFGLVIGAVLLGYAITRIGGANFGPEFGVFIAGLSMGALSNLYAGLTHRPGALLREPGIILLVPGSVGFKSLSFVFERDVFLGIDTAFSLVTILVSLVAGLLFGDLIVPPRRSL